MKRHMLAGYRMLGILCCVLRGRTWRDDAFPSRSPTTEAARPFTACYSMATAMALARPFKIFFLNERAQVSVYFIDREEVL